MRIIGMPIPKRLFVTLLGACLLAAATAGILSLPKPTEPDPIALLHQCIQQRFQDRTLFGMMRVLPNRNHGVRQFMPENTSEHVILSDIKQQGYQVALYLVGRYALEAPQVGDNSRFGLQGPAFMTAETKDLPNSAELLSLGRRALASFDYREGYDVHSGPWTVALRPLRATSISCVQCHTSGPAAMSRDRNRAPKVGDALGSAMYIYRKV